MVSMSKKSDKESVFNHGITLGLLMSIAITAIVDLIDRLFLDIIAGVLVGLLVGYLGKSWYFKGENKGDEDDG